MLPCKLASALMKGTRSAPRCACFPSSRTPKFRKNPNQSFRSLDAKLQILTTPCPIAPRAPVASRRRAPRPVSLARPAAVTMAAAARLTAWPEPQRRNVFFLSGERERNASPALPSASFLAGRHPIHARAHAHLCAARRFQE